MMITTKKHRFWDLLLRGLAVIVMMFSGLMVTSLATLTAPENFSDSGYDSLTDLGAVRLGLGMLMLGLIPWYRKIPMVLIIAGGFYAVIMQGDPYVLAIGLTVWITRAQLRWQWVTAGVGLAAIVVNIGWHILAVLRRGDGASTSESILSVVMLGAAALGLVLAISLITRQRRRILQAHQVVESVEHDRDTISTQMTRQTEREYLAREVHDTLAQRLTALSLQAGHMQRTLHSPDQSQLAGALAETRQYSDQALADLRNLVTSLREHGEKETLVPSVAPGGFQDLTALFDDATHQGLTLQPRVVVNNYDAAPDGLQRAVLRITQEALTNVLRHSVDGTVQLRIEGQPGEGLVLEFTNLRNQGQDFDGGSGTGLLGIQERAELVGGTATVEHLPSHFRLLVHLPWAPAPTPGS